MNVSTYGGYRVRQRQITLHEGYYYDFHVTSTEYIHVESNAPVLIAQFCKSFGPADQERSDPFMSLVQPMSEYSNTYTFSTMFPYTKNDLFDNYVSVLIEGGADPGDFLLDGRYLTQDDFYSEWAKIRNANFWTVTLQVDEGSHRLSQKDDIPFGAMLYGFKYREGYGTSLGKVATEKWTAAEKEWRDAISTTTTPGPPASTTASLSPSYPTMASIGVQTIHNSLSDVKVTSVNTQGSSPDTSEQTASMSYHDASLLDDVITTESASQGESVPSNSSKHIPARPTQTHDDIYQSSTLSESTLPPNSLPHPNSPPHHDSTLGNIDTSPAGSSTSKVNSSFSHDGPFTTKSLVTRVYPAPTSYYENFTGFTSDKSIDAEDTSPTLDNLTEYYFTTDQQKNDNQMKSDNQMFDNVTSVSLSDERDSSSESEMSSANTTFPNQPMNSSYTNSAHLTTLMCVRYQNSSIGNVNDSSVEMTDLPCLKWEVSNVTRLTDSARVTSSTTFLRSQMPEKTETLIPNSNASDQHDSNGGQDQDRSTQTFGYITSVPSFNTGSEISSQTTILEISGPKSANDTSLITTSTLSQDEASITTEVSAIFNHTPSNEVNVHSTNGGTNVTTQSSVVPGLGMSTLNYSHSAASNASNGSSLSPGTMDWGGTSSSGGDGHESTNASGMSDSISPHNTVGSSRLPSMASTGSHFLSSSSKPNSHPMNPKTDDNLSPASLSVTMTSSLDTSFPSVHEMRSSSSAEDMILSSQSIPEKSSPPSFPRESPPTNEPGSSSPYTMYMTSGDMNSSSSGYVTTISSMIPSQGTQNTPSTPSALSIPSSTRVGSGSQESTVPLVTQVHTSDYHSKTTVKPVGSTLSSVKSKVTMPAGTNEASVSQSPSHSISSHPLPLSSIGYTNDSTMNDEYLYSTVNIEDTDVTTTLILPVSAPASSKGEDDGGIDIKVIIIPICVVILVPLLSIICCYAYGACFRFFKKKNSARTLEQQRLHMDLRNKYAFRGPGRSARHKRYIDHDIESLTPIENTGDPMSSGIIEACHVVDEGDHVPLKNNWTNKDPTIRNSVKSIDNIFPLVTAGSKEPTTKQSDVSKMKSKSKPAAQNDFDGIVVTKPPRAPARQSDVVSYKQVHPIPITRLSNSSRLKSREDGNLMISLMPIDESVTNQCRDSMEKLRVGRKTKLKRKVKRAKSNVFKCNQSYVSPQNDSSSSGYHSGFTHSDLPSSHTGSSSNLDSSHNSGSLSMQKRTSPDGSNFKASSLDPVMEQESSHVKFKNFSGQIASWHPAPKIQKLNKVHPSDCHTVSSNTVTVLNGSQKRRLARVQTPNDTRGYEASEEDSAIEILTEKR